jgi:RNA polymerase sigma-70 factor (ECF subfamily)
MPTTSEHERECDQELLNQTQAYLEYRSRGHDPPPALAAAWDRFYDCYARRLRGVLALLDMTAAEQEDCLQEVWMSVVAHLGKFQCDDGRACLSTWLTTVARNKAVDILRRRRRDRADGLFGSVEDALFDTSPDAAADCVRHEMQDQVRRLLAELSARVSARSYQVFYQRRIEGRTVPEIAVALNMKPNQVRPLDHRMLLRFRALLERSTDLENHRQ